jgi:transposase
MVKRLRDVLSGYFPSLERAFDYAHSRGALVVLTGYQTPAAIRGRGRLGWPPGWSRGRSAVPIRSPPMLWRRPRPSTRPFPAKDVAASIVADLANQILAIGARISDLDARITATFRAHPQAVIIESLPAMGPILGAELVAAAGDLNAYPTAGRLASAAGLVPVPRDSGRHTGVST